MRILILMAGVVLLAASAKAAPVECPGIPSQNLQWYLDLTEGCFVDDRNRPLKITFSGFSFQDLGDTPGTQTTPADIQVRPRQVPGNRQGVGLSFDFKRPQSSRWVYIFYTALLAPAVVPAEVDHNLLVVAPAGRDVYIGAYEYLCPDGFWEERGRSADCVVPDVNVVRDDWISIFASSTTTTASGKLKTLTGMMGIWKDVYAEGFPRDADTYEIWQLTEATKIPEPAGWVLVSLGLALLYHRRHRRAIRSPLRLFLIGSMLAVAAYAQEPVLSTVSAFDLDSGRLANSGSQEAVVFVQEIRIADAAWIRLNFSQVELAAGSFLRIRSRSEDSVLIMNAQDLAEWNYWTPLLDGDAVILELVAAPGSESNRLVLRQAVAGRGEETENESGKVIRPQLVCSRTDDRRPTNPKQLAIARMMVFSPSGAAMGICSAFMIDRKPSQAPEDASDRLLLSAGHCFLKGDGSRLTTAPNVVQFEPIPNSSNTCAQQQPPPEQQFVVRDFAAVRVQSGPNQILRDFAVFRLQKKNGQTAFERFNTALSLLPANQFPAADVTQDYDGRVTGYGADGGRTDVPPDDRHCARCRPDKVEAPRHHTQQTATGKITLQREDDRSNRLLRALIATCGGNSGGPMLREPQGDVLGILASSSFCNGDLATSSGTFIGQTTLSTLIASYKPTLLTELPPLLGKDLQDTMKVQLPSTATAELTLTLTADPAKLLLSKSPAQQGTGTLTLTIPAGQTESTEPIYVQAKVETSATITASAPGFTETPVTINLAPSAAVIATANGIVDQHNMPAGSNADLTFKLGALDAAKMFVKEQTLRPGAGPIAVTLQNSNTNVGTLSAGEVQFSTNESSKKIVFQALRAGTATITLTEPTGFADPAKGKVLKIVVQ